MHGTFPRMPARVPLDVELEDRLLYGLTPIRLAYAVGALLAAFALWSSPWGPGVLGGGAWSVVLSGGALLAAFDLWSSPWGPGVLRGVASSVVMGVGALMSWGRWRGTPADRWVVDFALFMSRTQRLLWTWPHLQIPMPLASRKA